MKNENIKVLVTGHSRGAAVSNIIGKYLDDGEIKGLENIDRNNIYIYTYATPNATSDNDRQNTKYSNIFNIVNPEDFVTKVLPAKWGYGRYGITYVLPSMSFYIFPMGFDNYTLYKDYVEAVKSQTANYIGSNAPKEALDYRIYDPYEFGMFSVTNYVREITSFVKNIDDYYGKSLFLWETREFSPKTGLEFSDRSLYAMFTRSLAYYMAGSEGSELKSKGLANLITAVAQWGWIGGKTEGYFIRKGFFNHEFGSAHAGETYMAMLDLVSVNTLKEDKYYHFCRVNCPVDVIISDSDNNVVGSIVDNKVDTTSDALAMNVEGDAKTFIIPQEADYTIKFVGNDVGSMDYTICEYEADTGEIKRTVYQDISLNEGTTYIQNLSGYEDAMNAPVYDESGAIIERTITLNEEDLGTLSVKVNIMGSGFVADYDSVSSGDYVTLTAFPMDNNEFLGWYDKESKLLSTESEYGLSVKESIELTAKFTEKEAKQIIKGDVTGDGDVAMGDVLKVARAVAGTVVLTEDEKKAADVTGDDEVAMGDVLRIARYVAGTINEF